MMIAMAWICPVVNGKNSLWHDLHMRDSDLLILDEPTADLDALAERQIYQQFLANKGDKTALIIFGRFSTIRMADAIAVMKNGTIVEYGTHDRTYSRKMASMPVYITHRQNNINRKLMAGYLIIPA